MGTIKADTFQHESASSGLDMDASGNATLSADLTVDTDTLKVDSTNDRVGINKASPTVALDVTGAITASGTITGNAFSGDGSSLTGISVPEVFTGTHTGANPSFSTGIPGAFCFFHAYNTTPPADGTAETLSISKYHTFGIADSNGDISWTQNINGWTVYCMAFKPAS